MSRADADKAAVRLSRRAEQIGLLAASGFAPGTFARSLGPRSALDQGVITGLVSTLSYVLTVGAQDVLGALATAGPARSAAEMRRRVLLADLVAIPAGIAVQRALPPRDDEPVVRSLARQAGWRAAVTGFGSLLFAGAGAAADRLDARIGADGRVSRLPVGVPVGVLVAAGLEWQRRRQLPDQPNEPESASTSALASVGTGLGVAAGLAALSVGERAVASWISGTLGSRLPGSTLTWRLAGHGLVLGAAGAGVSVLWSRAMRGIESGTSVVDPVLVDAIAQEWVLPTCSGSKDSLVSWASLGREGRRHVVSAVHPRPVTNRPAGVPDLSIPTVMKKPAVAAPIQIYVSLDSAPTARERVDLALAELDRTNAWDRSLLMLVSPTGTGYVNYCAVAAAEYLSLGDVATVTLQYSKRPSPLSLGKIDDAREQNRLLWLEITQRVRNLPSDRRPKVVLFGESLGAHTSQDVFMHWGTLGPEALGIDRALWIGTPYASRWMQQVTLGSRPDTDPAAVAIVNDFGQIEAMAPDRRAALRYVLVSHDNDGVTKFGTDLLLKAPSWLRDERSPVDVVPPYSPRGIPPSMRWRPVTTFFQLLVDMKNAQIPGTYAASGHDYRPDLTRFVSEVYGLPATEDELVRIEAALAEREAAREQLFAPEPPAADATSPEQIAG
ncbi:MAG TPA: alpha/beta-hydrolase family protein [Actinomycetes bacterium]|nr:alpha/beta-hydrolase family protein [Actinomycetes bacterium]